MTAADPPRRATSLVVRLILAAAAWLLLLLAVGGIVLALAFRGAVEEEFSYRLDAILKTIVASIEVVPGGGFAMSRPLGDPRFDRLYSGWYWQVTQPDGRQLRSRSLWDSSIPVEPGGPDMQVRRAEGPNQEKLLVVERDVEFPGQQGAAHVLVASDLREVSGGVQRFELLLMLALGTLAFGMIVAIVIQVRYGLRPLRQMLADLRSVREGAAARLSGRYPSEIAPLADGMNDVLDKDSELIERARTHVGNLAHALKTPLAVVSAEVQGNADRTVLTKQVQLMRRLIEHHLGRARASAGTGRLGLKTPVRSVAEAVRAVLAKIYQERGLEVDVDIPPGAMFRGHREDLEEIFGNLMENACKWAIRRVRVSAQQAQDNLLIRVEDDGPGISAERQAELLRRGRRLDEKSPGWGLGLAIVSDLVHLNGGELAFSKSELGGLCVDVALPSR
ncbi:sensor histidine kinase [Reyranella soli]|uniref:histidine kinase n=1 Tax=Reyranella soli TaxID=1230389 RepID=A0A512NCU7_9HYPH|nr:sensor histidine kinase [Reyranella soli]GEP56777.1 histidine kinase [Reyranella soli]